MKRSLITTALLFFLSPVQALPAAELPLLGIAHVGIRVSNLEQSRAFYHGVCGFEEAFDATKDGRVISAYFKVNDHQFIVASPGLTSGEAIALTHFAIRTDDIRKLHRMVAALGLNPGDVRRDPDGNLGFVVDRLPGQKLGYLEFLQYMPGSLSEMTLGMKLGARRLSTHLEHLGILTTDYAQARGFYVTALGFKDHYRRMTSDGSQVVIDQLLMPGPLTEFVELSPRAGALATLKRGNAHFALEVPNAAAVYQETLRRGVTGNRKPPRFGFDNRYNVSIFDPDGTRVEFMQSVDKAHPTPLVVYTPQL